MNTPTIKCNYMDMDYTNTNVVIQHCQRIQGHKGEHIYEHDHNRDPLI